MTTYDKERPGERPAFNDQGVQIGTWYSGTAMDRFLNRHWETHEEKEEAKQMARDAKKTPYPGDSSPKSVYEYSRAPHRPAVQKLNSGTRGTRGKKG